MVEKIIIANWKANKNLEEAVFWVEKVGAEILKFKKKVILCPPSMFLMPLKDVINRLNLTDFLFLGSQNLSHYPQGAYTGEVAASQLSGLVKFALVGHSERRKYFGETKEQIFEKINLAKRFGITPILCFDTPQIEEVFNISENYLIAAFEPISAIGTGIPETPEAAAQVVKQVKSRKPETSVLYGGSVTAENIDKFLEVCDGALIGTASIDSSDFLAILAKVP